MYIPNKQELEEMKFDTVLTSYDKVLGRYYIKAFGQLPYIEYNPGYEGWFLFSRGQTIPLSPKDKKQIQAIITAFNSANANYE